MTTAADYMKQAMARLNELISPAVLRDSPYNRQVVLGEVARLNLGQPATVDAAAMQFRKAVVSICNDPGRALNTLVWNVEPKSIQRFKPQQVENTQKIAEGQQAAINAEEKRKAHEKRQKAGEARAIELVNAFHPISYRGTEHGVMADTKKLLFDYIAKNKARNADMEDVANKVAAHIAAEYEKVERMGVNSR
jgi:hypothetical protein